MMDNINKMISESFLEVADYLENSRKKIKIGVTTIGSEHGVDHIVEAVEELKNRLDIDLVLIGESVKSNLPVIEVNSEEELEKKVDQMLENNELDAVVTMHHSFPIGVSTIGRVITPLGKEMYIATTTGTTATNRVEAMVQNAIYGKIVAESCGKSNPTVGILNIEGAKEVEKQLKKLKNMGYEINFGESKRADGGIILRGNDLILGSCDVVVTDSLTGNILMKLFSAFNSGGKVETIGYGYGPGISFGYDKKIFIVSRASGKNIIKGAIEYAIDVVKGGLEDILKLEEKKLDNLNFREFLADIKGSKREILSSSPKVEKEIVTAQIPGVDIMELDSAVEYLNSYGIYAEAGMGCTGPIIMVNEKKLEIAKNYLMQGEFIS